MNRKAYMSILLAVVFLAFAFLTGCSSGTSKSATGTTYVFYLSGLEASNGGPNIYTVAGAVTVDSSGNVTAGEEDYNDGFGLTDAPTLISTGTLTADPVSGQGTLTLTVGDANLGASGVETLGIQLVNANHALITQFDGSATSSGSLDLQSATTASGNFAFTISGVNTAYDPTASGGVVTVAGGAMNGVFDINDFDLGIFTDVALTAGTVSDTDAFRRGTITGTQLSGSLAYYVVGPEAVRLISDDTDAALIGSAYGQGTCTFSAASIGSSVFGILGDTWGELYGAAGSFTTDGVSAVTGIGDDDENSGSIFSGVAIDGSYTMGSTGYGSVTITAGELQDVSALGVYATDPTLNLLDPNNTTGGGGALILDLDGFLTGGTGVLLPQTDTNPADFTGSSSSYAFGAQAFGGSDSSTAWEWDAVGQGAFTAGAFAGTGLVNDVFDIFGTATPDTGVTFTGTPAPDAAEATTGRYTMLTGSENPFVITVIADSPLDYSVVVYQASGTQAFLLDEDTFGTFLGPMEQQGTLGAIPAVKKAMAKSPTAHKR